MPASNVSGSVTAISPARMSSLMQDRYRAAGFRSIEQLHIVRRLWRRLDRDCLDRGAAVRLGPAMRGAFRDDDEVSGLDLHFFVAEPDRARAFQDILHLIGIRMHVLWHVAGLDRQRH